MYSISAKFQETLLSPNQLLAIRVEVMQDGIITQDISTAVLDGTVSIASKQAVRRRLTLQVVDRDGTLTPSVAGDLLTPYGTEIKVYRGLTLSTGVDELVPQGVFRIASVDIEESEGLQIRIDGYDRAWAVARSRFTETYVVASGLNYSDAIKTLIDFRSPGLPYNFIGTGFTTPQLIFDAGSDPWEAAQKMAAAIGCELYFDVNGVCTLRQILQPKYSPTVWDYSEGEDALILAAGRRFDAERKPNWFIVTGESPDNAAPARGEAKDTDPESPTNVNGRYGAYVEFLTESGVGSDSQAITMAQAKLAETVGQDESINFPSVVNPAHDVGDVVRIKTSKAKIDALYIMDEVTVPLGPNGALNSVCRRIM